MKLRLVRDWLVYIVARVFICVLQALRMETCRSLARGLSFLVCGVLKIRHKVVDENLRHAFGELSERQRHALARQMWEHLVLMLCEIAHAPRKLHETNWRDHISFVNKRAILQKLLSPKPAVIVTGHFGNFEAAGFTLGLLGFPTFTVARPLDNPFLDRFVNRFREATGQYILPKEGSARQLDALLASGETIVLVGDQAAGPKGCWIEFFGRPASCHKAVALFTLTSKVPMIVGFAYRSGEPLQFTIGADGIADPADQCEQFAGVKPATQWYSDCLERVIRRAPEQYWWLHRRWKDTRKPRKKKKAA